MYHKLRKATIDLGKHLVPYRFKTLFQKKNIIQFSMVIKSTNSGESKALWVLYLTRLSNTCS